MPPRKKKEVYTPDPRPTLLGLLLWTVAACSWLMLAAALASFSPADWPNHAVAPHNDAAQNLIGPVGAWLSYHVYLMIGPGVWLLMASLLLGLMAQAMGKKVSQPMLRLIGLLMMAIAASSIIAISLPKGMMGFGQGPQGSGGLLAAYIDTELSRRFGTLGAGLVLTLAFWVGALIAMDELVVAIGRGARNLAGSIVGIKLPRPLINFRMPSMPSLAFLGSGAGSDAGTATIDEPVDEDAAEDPNQDEPDVRSVIKAAAKAHKKAQQEEPEVEAELDDDEEEDVADAPGAYIAEKKQEFSPDQLRAKMKQLPINFAAPVKQVAEPPREVDLSGYKFPEMSLLEEPEESFTQEIESIVREQAMQLESALQQYRIEGNVVGVDSGPAITLFEVRLAPGTKVSQLNAISSDLARSMRAHNIRIVPTMAGKDTIGIEVPNIKKEKVRLKELMLADPEVPKKMKLPMWLGKDASGSPLIADLTTMPHMLIAGTTGSGKSVCMNSIIMSFLYTKRPDELKLVLVDPKMVEMSMYRDVPHLMCPVVTEMPKATAILEWATTKMDERYELLAEAGVRDIASYNDLGWDELKERLNPATEAEEARIPKKLPYMVFIIDELADLMMTNKEVEGHIVRIAQKARAVGMHLILATQRPQANVVTGLIKGNMPCRVSFKVASRLDSRIVLDQSGAELLLGHGDMMFLSPRTSKIIRCQGTLVDDIEIRKSVKFLKTVAAPSFEPQLVQLKSADLSEGEDERDELFDEAVKVVLQHKRGSVSLLQRRLTIGYGRASRIIEQMAASGILGEYKGSQAREVTMTLEEYEAIKAQAEADAADGMVGFDKPAQDDEGVPDEMDDEYSR